MKYKNENGEKSNLKNAILGTAKQGAANFQTGGGAKSALALNWIDLERVWHCKSLSWHPAELKNVCKYGVAMHIDGSRSLWRKNNLSGGLRSPNPLQEWVGEPDYAVPDSALVYHDLPFHRMLKRYEWMGGWMVGRKSPEDPNISSCSISRAPAWMNAMVGDLVFYVGFPLLFHIVNQVGHSIGEQQSSLISLIIIMRYWHC